jgi:hypothetical protein
MPRPPIFVLGPGRSGTSFCTMLLYTRFGVNMGNAQWIGNAWRKMDWRTTKGHWERCSVRSVLHGVLNGHLEPNVLIELLKELEDLHGDQPWGAKHPNLTLVLEMIVEYFPDAWYIYCTRDIEENARSMQSLYCKGSDPGLKEYELEKYRLKCKQHNAFAKTFLADLKRVTTIPLDMYKTHGNEYVVEQLSEFLELPQLHETLPVPPPFHDYGPSGGLKEFDKARIAQRRAKNQEDEE